MYQDVFLSDRNSWWLSEALDGHDEAVEMGLQKPRPNDGSKICY